MANTDILSLDDVEVTGAIPDVNGYDETLIKYRLPESNIAKLQPTFTVDVYNCDKDNLNQCIIQLYNELSRIANIANSILQIIESLQLSSSAYSEALRKLEDNGYVFGNGHVYGKEDLIAIIDKIELGVIKKLREIYYGLCKLHMEERDKLFVARRRAILNNDSWFRQYPDGYFKNS